MKEFHYRIAWRACGSRPGHHAGLRYGAGFEFISHVPLQSGADPRRVDVRASLADPWGSWWVRVHRQRASIPVILVADLSASMGFAGVGRKLDVLSEFAQALAFSAYRSGDSFGFIGCDENVIEEWLFPAGRGRAAGEEVARWLAGWRPCGSHAEGLVAAADYLGSKRALVFLASDYHFPLGFLDRLLEAYARHDIVPLVVWDEAEIEAPARFGWKALRDAESGRRRMLFIRRALRDAWRAAYETRRTQLLQAFAQRDLRPLFLIGGFQPDVLTAHFFA